MRSGKTSSGFKYKYDERILNDMRFVDAIVGTIRGETEDSSRLVAYHDISELLLGKEQKKALYAHIMKNNDGYVPMDVLDREINEMLTGAKPDDKTIKN